MSTLHAMVPFFFAIQFILILIALVSVLLSAGPESSIPVGRLRS